MVPRLGSPATQNSRTTFRPSAIRPRQGYLRRKDHRWLSEAAKHSLATRLCPLTATRPFHSQFEYLSQPKPQTSAGVAQYAAHPFDMAGMAHSLPSFLPLRGYQQTQYEVDAPNVFSPGSVYQMHHAAQFPAQGGPQHESTNLTAHSMPFPGPQYQPEHMPAHGAPRSPGHALHAQMPYGYGTNGPQFPAVDPRLSHPGFVMNTAMGEMSMKMTRLLNSSLARLMRL
jgi:hypothetical protein